MYYDDEEGKNTAICYAGHPVDFVRSFGVPARLMREPNIKDLVERFEVISGKLMDLAIHKQLSADPRALHELWSEKFLINEELYERRMLSEMKSFAWERNVFLCHSSTDKWFVRMVNDDLCRLGAKTWLDENEIRPGDSIVEKISDGIRESRFMVVFLSETSIKSRWAKREWQSFLSRQLTQGNVTVLPLLIEDCPIPPILADIKFADFRESYHDGLKSLHAALA